MAVALKNGNLSATAAPQPNVEAISGLVERVTYHNNENGWSVLRVNVKGHKDLVTVVGNLSMISAEEYVQASGIWIHDRQHGNQFKAEFLKATPPTSLEGIEKYLGSGMIKGIGPVYAKSWLQSLVKGYLRLLKQTAPSSCLIAI